MTLPPEDRDLIARVRKFADRLIERAANIASNPDGGPDDEMSLRITGLEGRDIGEDLHRLANVAAARAEAAPVVDDEAVERALDRYNLVAARETRSPRIDDMRAMRAALEAALNPSREVKS